MRKIGTILVFMFLFATVAASQNVYTPQNGSKERKAILDVLRVPVEKQLKQTIVFAADTFNVSGGWAFIGGQPQTRDGGPPSYRGTKYQQAVDADMFDNNIFALLKRTAGKWKVVTFAIGCTDVCYLDWSRRYRAPKAVFPYTE